MTPQACSRLRQLASIYKEKTNSTFQEIFIADRLDSVRDHLCELKTAHVNFSLAYTKECLELNPIDQISSKLPITCDLFLRVFLNDYEYLSSSIANDPQFWIRLPTLAIELLLISKERSATEVFKDQSDRIYKMSGSYGDLSLLEKEKLHQKLLGKDITLQPCTHELYKSIYECQAQVSLTELRDPQSFLNHQSKKADKIYKHVTESQISRKSAARSIAQWYLKTPGVELEELPSPYYQIGHIAKQLEGMKKEGHERGLDELSEYLASHSELHPWLDFLVKESE